MPHESDAKKPNWSHLAWAIGGALAGSWLARNELENAKKSRAELDNPAEAEEAYGEIGELLDQWRPDSDCETEDDFTQDLADYLQTNTDWEIELYPDTPEGKPDILIGDLIALELKVNPSKSERDRCIGQCAGYSRLWITWMVMIDASSNKIGRLEDLLEDKGLENILVWTFS
ncbi:MAG: hypothetical protein AABN34_08515 [Acidobacteriota bacterium]